MRIFVAGAAACLVTSCATYRAGLGTFEQDLRANEPARAAELIKDRAFKDGDDQVVYLLEYATARQMAGDYVESTRAFLEAERQTDVKDYHSVSRLTGSLLLNEGLVQYKGDDYEKVMINAMLAINYLMMNQPEDARVECRKINDKLKRYRFEGKKNYGQNPFAYYLSALIWESGRDWDSAYIDFNNTHDVNPSLGYLGEDLIRAAKNARRAEDVTRWTKAYPGVRPTDLNKVGEAILIYQSGWGPDKRPHPQFARIPKLYPVPTITVRARFEVENGAPEVTQDVLDVSEVAIKTLDEQYAELIALRVAGMATKAVVSDQIRQRNELLGNLAWVGMNLLDRADLRQWSSLPGGLQVARLRLKPGHYRVRAVGLDAAGADSGEAGPWVDVDVKARAKKFVNWRSVK